MRLSASLHVILGGPACSKDGQMEALGKEVGLGSPGLANTSSSTPVLQRAGGVAVPHAEIALGRPLYLVESIHWISDRRKRPGCGHVALFGDSTVGPEVTMASAYRGPPRVLLAEMSRGSGRTSEGRDNQAHGNALTMPSSLGSEQFLGSKSQTLKP